MTRIVLRILNNSRVPMRIRKPLMRLPFVVPNYEWSVWISRRDQERRDRYSQDFAAWCRAAKSGTDKSYGIN